MEIFEVKQNLKTTSNGLSNAQANKRLAKDGKNEFEKVKPKPLIVRFINQIVDPMIIILLCAAVISAFLAMAQNESFADVFIILAVVIINAILGVYQEAKAEKSLEALKQMSAQTSKVLRDGKVCEIKSENICKGDVVILETGDAVPADGRIIEAVSLKIEEAALTGESVPVDKLISVLEAKDDFDIALGDKTNMAYMGSTVVYGRGKMIVTDIGMNTEMGKIAGALQKVEESKTPLQIKMTQLSKYLT